VKGFSDERYLDAHWKLAPIPVAWIGLDGRFIEVNRAVCEFTGYAESELLKLTWQQITNPQDIEGDAEEIRKATYEGVMGYSLLKRYIRKDGVQKWLNLHVRVIRNASGSVDHFVSWILPLPNGSHYKVDVKNEKIHVRPSVKAWDFLKDNWKFSSGIAFIFLISLAEKMKETVTWFLELLK
jgi:PAS domain S-box-containing protein